MSKAISSSDKGELKRPTPLTVNFIRKYGTEEQKKELDSLLDATKTQSEIEAEQRLAEYNKKLNTAPVEVSATKRLQADLERMYRRNRKISSKETSIPNAEIYKLVKEALWFNFKQEVANTSKIGLTMEGRESLLTALHQVAHWLVGDTVCECAKRLDPDQLVPAGKSIYLWGTVGTGKSTLARACAATTKTVSKYTGLKLNYASIGDEVHKVKNTGKMADLERLFKGGWVLDELSENVLQYKHFGNDMNLAYDILMRRHNVQQETGAPTLITSNIAPHEFQVMLNDSHDRIVDRLAQEYFAIEVKGQSFRRLKSVEHGK